MWGAIDPLYFSLFFIVYYSILYLCSFISFPLNMFTVRIKYQGKLLVSENLLGNKSYSDCHHISADTVSQYRWCYTICNTQAVRIRIKAHNTATRVKPLCEVKGYSGFSINHKLKGFWNIIVLVMAVKGQMKGTKHNRAHYVPRAN